MVPESVRERIAAVAGRAPVRYLYVNVARQRLELRHGDALVAEYSVSTAARGTGNREGSYQTPRGMHRIVEKYGDGAPAGRILRDRLDTGDTWQSSDPADDLVLTRILRLGGIEDGVNRGPGIDSYSRYIYIHGTSREHLVGSPASHGCVVMRNADVIDLFDRVKEGDIVVID